MGHVLFNFTITGRVLTRVHCLFVNDHDNVVAKTRTRGVNFRQTSKALQTIFKTGRQERCCNNVNWDVLGVISKGKNGKK